MKDFFRAPGAKITGVVMDYDTKKSVTNATVRLFLRKGKPDDKGWAPVEETKISAQLDSSGKFSLPVSQRARIS